MEETKYVTLKEGIDFRRIAKIMTDAGFQMNHATARNVLMSGLHNLISGVSKKWGASLTDEQIKTILKNPQIHEAITDILEKEYKKGTYR